MTKDPLSGQVGEQSPESASGLLPSHLAKPFSHTEGDMNFLCELLEASVTNLAVRSPSRGPGLGHHCLISAGQALHSQIADHRQHWRLSLGLGTEEVCPREPSEEESEPGRDPVTRFPLLSQCLDWSLVAGRTRQAHLSRDKCKCLERKKDYRSQPLFSLDMKLRLICVRAPRV